MDWGNIILKTTYSEVVSLTSYLSGEAIIDDGNFTFFNVKFQIDGNTALHLFALNESALKLILEYYLKNKPGFLWSAAMKNKQGKTPLDITIEYDSPRCTNLLLSYLWNRKNGNLSSQIYKLFPALLARGLKPFHEFLNTWFYQTLQMKSIKYLALKSNEDVFMTAYSGWLLDSKFFEKYTDQSRIKRKLAEKRIWAYEASIWTRRREESRIKIRTK